MSLIDLLRAPWAILPDRLDEIQSVYAAHFRGDKIDIDAIEARLGKKLGTEPPKFEMRSGGVAILNITGAIAPKANLFTQISGGASAQQLVQQLEAMADSAAVRGAVLVWDSPGGSVQGIPTLARAVRALADAKPTVSVSDGVMASAAYWAACGATAVYASGQTDAVGSIGVVATHIYEPRSAGRQTTEIVAGRYKRMATDSKPLSAEGEAYLQAQVDEIYKVFVETVADARGVSVEDVLAHMADGRVFIGRQAVAAGLVEGFATAEELADRMAQDPGQFAARRRASIAAVAAPSPLATAPGAVPVVPARSAPVLPAASAITATATPAKETPMSDPTAAGLSAEQIAATNPAAFDAIRAQGADLERQRIAAVRAQAMPGHEKLIEALAADGKTTGPEAAVAVLSAERNLRESQQRARAADAPKPLPQEPAADDAPIARNLGNGGRLTAGVDAAALDCAARTYMAAHPGTEYLAAVKAVQVQAQATTPNT